MEKQSIHSKADSGSGCSNGKDMDLAIQGKVEEKVRPSSSTVLKTSSSKSTHVLRTGTTLDDFEVLSTIGTGSYGTCKKIKRKKDGKVLVWKELDYGSMTESEKEMLVSEVNLLRELKSPYIVRYYDRIIDRARTTIYIIMEYCKGGDLSVIIAKCKRDLTYLDEDFIWKILIQVTLALQECHKRKNGRAILHRDMKPANVFLDTDSNVKLGDFGLARVLHHETSFANTYVGTPYYMSPELVNNMSYNEKSDVWSMGCVLYELCAFHPPFTASNQTELNRKIRQGDFVRLPKMYSNDLNLIIQKMLHVEVSSRPSIEALLADSLITPRRAKVERQHASSHNATDLRGWESDLKLLERELDQRKRDLDTRERELAIREKLLEDKDKCASVREKLADEKFSRAESLLREYERKMRLDTDRLLHSDREGTVSDSSDGLASCITKKKDADTPKKKVSFDVFGKENQRFKDRYKDLTSKYSDYESTYIQELVKRQELKDRLYQVKSRAMDLHRKDTDRTSRTNMLLFR